MPTKFPPRCADEPTDARRRERIAALFARAVLRRLAALRSSSPSTLDEPSSTTTAARTFARAAAPRRPAR